MASYCDDKSLNGFSHWFKTQAQEEVGHAMKIYNYLDDLGHRVILDALPQPLTQFSSVLDLFEKALEHEKKLANRLNEISGMASAENDNTTHSFLSWFLTEQVEEISIVSTVVDKLKLIGDNGHGILMLNDELGARALEPSTA
jgi:ferritin